MKKCKFCLAEIEDSEIRCPACGKDLTEDSDQAPAEEIREAQMPEEEAAEAPAAQEPAEEPRKATPGKIALAVAAIVVLVALLAGLILMGMRTKQAPAEETTAAPTLATEETVPATVPADGEAGTVTEKGTYSVSDADMLVSKDTVVAKVGDKTLTNGQLQVYYWMGVYMNASNAQYFGLDFNQPLDVQIANSAVHSQESDMTWQQYFLQFALDSWHQAQAMALEAEKAGLEMRDEDRTEVENLKTTTEESIAAYGLTLDEYMRRNFGVGGGFAEYEHYHQLYFQGTPYYDAEQEKMVPTEEELDAYFAENEARFAEAGVTKDTRLVDVRHILLIPENPAEDGTYTEEAWAACEQQAQELLNTWKAGKKTEESFAELVSEHSADPGSSTNGGLYENVYEGQMVQAFNDWCFDRTRQVGDTDVVQTEYGCHIMYFVDAKEGVWMNYAYAEWLTEQSDALLAEVVERNPMEVYYDKIALGLLPEA